MKFIANITFTAAAAHICLGGFWFIRALTSSNFAYEGGRVARYFDMALGFGTVSGGVLLLALGAIVWMMADTREHELLFSEEDEDDISEGA